MKYMLDTYSDMESVEKLIDGIRQGFTRGERIRWAIVDKKEDTFIGSCGFYLLDKNNLKGELSYSLEKTYRNKGIATEAVCNIVKFGFEKIELNRIEANVFVENIASQRVLEKAGLIKEAKLRDYYFSRGNFVDIYLYSKLKRDI